ncbi:MAG: hypothetical protein Kow00114_19620 [Kiloniellaceae bacterium]
MPTFLVAMLAAAGAAAADLDPDAIPQVNGEARDALAGDYAKARDHKAFVIGPSGAWQWTAKKSSDEDAVKQALDKCNRRVAPHKCQPYAIGNEVVLDSAAWAAVLAPYPSAADAAKAKIGIERGQRMHDLVFTTAEGEKRKLSDYRGKIVVLHIWGSWCPPCQREMPSLSRLYASLKDNPAVAFVPIGVKETYSKSKRWADGYGFDLPYVDGDAADSTLSTAEGRSIDFRDIANKVPTTYFLDRNGLVVFQRTNAFYRWEDFMPQIDHLIANGATN